MILLFVRSGNVWERARKIIATIKVGLIDIVLSFSNGLNGGSKWKIDNFEDKNPHLPSCKLNCWCFVGIIDVEPIVASFGILNAIFIPRRYKVESSIIPSSWTI